MKKSLLLLLTAALAAGVDAQTYVSQAGNAVAFSNSAATRLESSVGQPALQPINAITIEAWVRASCCQSAENTIVSFGDGTTNAYTLSIGSYGPRLVMRTAGGTYKDIRRTVKPDALDVNRDYHVAVTWSASTNTATIYIDGFKYLVNDTVGATGIYYGTGNKLVVGANTALTDPFNGKIDELRIWNSALSQSAIRANINQSLNGNETGLAAYYKFNEPAGSTTFADATGNAATLTGINTGAANRAVSSAEIPSRLTENIGKIQNAAWSNPHTVARGITSKYKLFDTLFGNKVSVTIMDIDLSATDVDLRIANLPANTNAALAKMKTSEIMRKYGAIAAINGSYYSTSSPYGGATFLRENGTTTVNTNIQHGVGYPDDKAIVFNNNTTTAPQIINRPQPNQNQYQSTFVSGWNGYTGFENVMSSGPNLLTGGNVTYEYVPMDISHEGTSGRGAWSWHMSAYPFTAIGVTANNHLIMAVGDGKFASSGGPAGINCPNLAHFMKALGCTDAMKMDGGGSSTMTIEGETYSDVVNYPSDNGLFDHEGERANPNALLLVPRNKRGSGSALYFDGANNKVAIQDSVIGNPQGSFSVEGWAKIDAGATNTDELINKNENTTVRKGYYIEYNNASGKLVTGMARSNNSWGSVTASTPAWTANQWHHFAMTYNTTTDTLKLYVDGQNAGVTYVPDPVFSNRPLCLGGSDAYPANGLKGALDEVRIWNKELSAAELKQSMHRNVDTAATNLAAYYKMDEFYVGTVKDYSINHKNGSATGGMNLHSIIASYAPIAGAKFDSLSNLAANWWPYNTGSDSVISWQAPINAENKYLLHAATTATGDTAAGLPFGISRRLNKAWLLDKFGLATEALNLTFNAAGLDAGVLDTTRQYYLLYATDGMNYKPVNQVPVVFSTQNISFANVEVKEGWYTLGWQPAQRSTVPGNHAFKFDGNTNIVRVPGFGNPAGNFSIELWARPDAGGSGDDAIINANENSSSRKGYFIEYGYANSASPGLKAGIAQTGSTWATALYSGAAWQPGQWHHVVMTYDTTSKVINLYQDGLPVATATIAQGAAVYSTRPFAIGGSDYYTANGFNGAIDEVRVWDKVLTQAEIVASMHLEASPQAAGLKGYFKLDSLGTGNAVINAVANSTNGLAATSVTGNNVVTSYAPIEVQPTTGFTSYQANWFSRNTAYNNALAIQSGYSSEPAFLLHATNNLSGVATNGVPASVDARTNRVWKLRKQGLGLINTQLQFFADSLSLPMDSINAVYLMRSDSNTNFKVIDSLTGVALSDTLQFNVQDTLNTYVALGWRKKTYTPPPPPPPTGIGQAGLDQYALSVYPNPVTSLLHVSFTSPEAGMATINLYDVTGRQLIRRSLIVNARSNEYQIPVSMVPAGYYILQLTVGKSTYQQSVIKE